MKGKKRYHFNYIDRDHGNFVCPAIEDKDMFAEIDKQGHIVVSDSLINNDENYVVYTQTSEI